MEETMKIDSDRVRKLRGDRAWSQEHLASVAGVSLRTVQRVEAEGISSFETTMALASAFGIAVADLSRRGPSPTRGMPIGQTLGVVFGVAGAVAGMGFGWFGAMSTHVSGLAAGQTYGLMWTLTGLGCAFIGVIVGRWRRTRRSIALIT